MHPSRYYKAHIFKQTASQVVPRWRRISKTGTVPEKQRTETIVRESFCNYGMRRNFEDKFRLPSLKKQLTREGKHGIDRAMMQYYDGKSTRQEVAVYV